MFAPATPGIESEPKEAGGSHWAGGGDVADSEAGSDILNLDEMEGGQDESTFPTQQSRPSSSAEAPPLVANNLYKLCKCAAAKLNIQWPAAQETEGIERDLYDGKRFPPAQPPAKQLLPVVPAYMKEMRRFWSGPYKSKLATQGYSKLEVHGMSDLGLAEPPAVEPSVAYHLHPNCRDGARWSTFLQASVRVCTNMQLSLSAPLTLSRCCELIRLRFWRTWANSWIQGSQIQDFDLLLHSSHEAVQGIMGLAERALWLNLSG
eukprot:superscaffoldBa00008431_g23344